VSAEFRIESDLLGEAPVAADALYGIHTVRALENFHLTGRPVHGELVRAYGTVKLAAALVNRELGVWAADPAKADAIERACREVADGLHDDKVVVERLQGGAGTSTNMVVNELIANCLKHAFPGDRGGLIEVALQPLTDSELWRLVVSDNGVGLPTNLASGKAHRSLGMPLPPLQLPSLVVTRGSLSTLCCPSLQGGCQDSQEGVPST